MFINKHEVCLFAFISTGIKNEVKLYSLTKSNPKHFWKYIKSKSSRNINVGELKSVDANGKEIWITEDQDSFMVTFSLLR